MPGGGPGPCAAHQHNAGVDLGAVLPLLAPAQPLQPHRGHLRRRQLRPIRGAIVNYLLITSAWSILKITCVMIHFKRIDYLLIIRIYPWPIITRLFCLKIAE